MSNPVNVRAAYDPNKGAFGFLNRTGEALIAGTDSVASRSAYAYAKSYEKFLDPLGQQIGSVSTRLDSVNTTLTNSLSRFSDTIRKALEPISDFTGSTLGTLTGVLKDPLGSNGLGNVVTNLLNNVSPGYGNKVNGTITNLNLQALANFPKQLFSSADHLITAVDNILAIPLNLLAQVYYGYLDIMKSISKLLSNIMNGFTQFILDFLDSIIPIQSILDLLNQVSTLSNQIGGIATTFLGVNQITGFANQVINFSSQIGGILNNPLDLVVSVLPEQVDQYIFLVNNPQQIINQFLPPELSQSFAKISSMTGFGFNGNMGFGFQSVLQGLQGGVIRSILTNYAAQYNILAPLVAGTGNNRPPSYSPSLVNGKYSPGALQDEAQRGNNPQQYPVGP
jgi:hypothetical protein